MTKYGLENGDIVTLRNKNKLIYIDEDFRDLSDSNYNTLTDINDLNQDLTRRGCGNTEEDIIKVERPVGYNTVFTRAKEMTIAEISKELGYEVKVIKEDE